MRPSPKEPPLAVEGSAATSKALGIGKTLAGPLKLSEGRSRPPDRHRGHAEVAHAADPGPLPCSVWRESVYITRSSAARLARKARSMRSL